MQEPLYQLGKGTVGGSSRVFLWIQQYCYSWREGNYKIGRDGKDQLKHNVILYSKKNLVRIYANVLHNFLDTTNGFPDIVPIHLVI